MIQPGLFLTRLFCICCLFLISQSPLKANQDDKTTNQDQKFVVLKCRAAGMFSICNDVLSLLNSYEKRLYLGIKVDFDTSGFYYDTNRGPNWWNYYFKPICYGFSRRACTSCLVVDGESLPHAVSRPALRAFNRHSAHKLITKYIHPKSYLKAKIKRFTEDHFKGFFVFGIHYRGTDKVLEAPRIAYENVLSQLVLAISTLQPPQYKIFVATDEANFLRYMQMHFPHKICHYAEALRSHNGQAIHLDPQNNRHKRGEDAIIDCLLLSHTDLLLRTSSNLSLWSTYFNPNLPVVELNERYVP